MKYILNFFWYLAFWPGYLGLWIAVKERKKGNIRKSKKDWKNRHFWAPIVSIFIYFWIYTVAF